MVPPNRLFLRAEDWFVEASDRTKFIVDSLNLFTMSKKGVGRQMKHMKSPHGTFCNERSRVEGVCSKNLVNDIR